MLVILRKIPSFQSESLEGMFEIEVVVVEWKEAFQGKRSLYNAGTNVFHWGT